MAHGKDPAWSFYSSDYLLDPDVMAIDPAHEGALVRMWSILWLHGRMTIDQLRAFAPMMRCDPDVVSDLADRFLISDDDGRLYSERMEAEREERAEKSRSASERGKIGGKRSGEVRRKQKADREAGGEAELEANSKQSFKQTRSKAPSKTKPSASASASASNPSDVSRVPDSDPSDPSDPHPPTNAHGVPGGSDGVLAGGGTGPVHQNASDSPVTRSVAGKVSTHHPPRERAAQGHSGAFPGNPASRHGPKPASNLVGSALRLLGGGAA